MPYANSPRLITPRLVLRRFAPEDLPAMLAILGDRGVNTFLPWFPVSRVLRPSAQRMPPRFTSFLPPSDKIDLLCVLP